MFNISLKQKIKELESDFRRLEIRVNCLSNWHVWAVDRDLIIRCKHCYKRALNNNTEQNCNKE